MAQQREGEICAEWLVVRPTTGEISVSGDELGGPKTVIVVSMILLLYVALEGEYGPWLWCSYFTG